MHGRTRLLSLVIAGALVLPASAAASPIPPGTYDVNLTGGTVDIGSLLPPLALSVPVSFPVGIGSQAVTTPLVATVPDAGFNTSASGYSVSGTLKTTVVTASATIDPVAVSASLDISFYANLDMTASLLGTSTMGSCSFGSPAQPIALHLTSAQGKEWDATTGLFSLADRTFAMPTPSCSPALIGSLISLVTGNTDSGHNSATIDGQATRHPDAPVTSPPTTATTQTTTSNSNSTTPTGATPTTTGAGNCVIPNLIGKRLAAAKAALRAAGCKPGTVKSKKSKKKKGLVIAQGRRAGVKLPVGSKVVLTVSRGIPKTRKHHSR